VPSPFQLREDQLLC